MKFSQAIAEIVSEFSGINHTPDFKAVRSMSTCSRPGSRGSSRSASGSSSPVRKHSTERKYSTMITVGADELPTVSITPSNGSTTPEHPRLSKNNSSPNFINLREKLNNIKRTSSSTSCTGLKEVQEEEFQYPVRKASSISSYRLI